MKELTVLYHVFPSASGGGQGLSYEEVPNAGRQYGHPQPRINFFRRRLSKVRIRMVQIRASQTRIKVSR